MVRLERLLSMAATGLFLSAALTLAAQAAPSDPPPPPPDEVQPPPPPVPPEAPPPATAEDKDDPDAVICRRVQPAVGSRLGGQKVCKTRREWQREQMGQIPHLPDNSIKPPPSSGNEGGRAPLS